MSVARPRARWLITAVLSWLFALTLTAPGASAHGANGQPIPDAAHYLTKLTGISPAIPGISASVDPRGEWLAVTNATSKTLTILGYAREPYLQIDPAGVSENSFSPTLALNQSLFGDMSQLGDSAMPPSWRHTSRGHEVRWHDHRIHWMGADRPPAVKADSAVAHLVGTWNVHLTLAGTPMTITGTLNWLPMKPGPSTSLTAFLITDTAVFGVLVASVGWFVHRRRTGRRAAAAATSGGMPWDDGLGTGGSFGSVTADTPVR
ncbi:MAG: hypothetical protein QOD87_1196 [Pseudonocardiales bacterium]|jgi:hypothetical protein|nr:hypothetical protein [Pseudonocardiales bacterium]